jgi:hypothetical protein
MATMTSFFSRCLPEGAVLVRTPAEEVLLQGGNPSQVGACRPASANVVPFLVQACPDLVRSEHIPRFGLRAFA